MHEIKTRAPTPRMQSPHLPAANREALAQNPESGLMILARHLIEVSRHRAALQAGGCESDISAAADALGARADELLERLVEMRATTLAGTKARAAALIAYSPAEAEPWGTGNVGTAHALARSIIRDLAALEAPSAPDSADPAPPARDEEPASAEVWAAQTFTPIAFSIPSKAEFLAESLRQYDALPMLKAVLERDDEKLSACAAEAPEANFELLDWFDGISADLQRNAQMLKMASVRLGVALARVELAIR